MIDLHSHILPGYDDGVRTIEEARALARAAAAEGVTAIAATPHVRDDYPTRPERMERGVAILNADFAAEGIPIEVAPGGELSIERALQLPTADLRRFTLGATGRWLLVEFPYVGWPALLEPTVAMLRSEGIDTLLAHPERSREVQADPTRLEPLVAAGMRVQVTAASLDGRLGAAARACALELVRLDLAQVLATDAHAPAVRQGGLAGGVEAIEDEGVATRLTTAAPRAILAAEDVPRGST